MTTAVVARSPPTVGLAARVSKVTIPDGNRCGLDRRRGMATAKTWRFVGIIHTTLLSFSSLKARVGPIDAIVDGPGARGED